MALSRGRWLAGKQDEEDKADSALFACILAYDTLPRRRYSTKDLLGSREALTSTEAMCGGRLGIVAQPLQNTRYLYLLSGGLLSTTGFKAGRRWRLCRLS
jgi:hypothetical protein